MLELERTFLYLCLHDGGLLDIQALCTQLGQKKPTVNRFIDVLEAAHLIYRLAPYGYGKEILRGKFKSTSPTRPSPEASCSRAGRSWKMRAVWVPQPRQHFSSTSSPATTRSA